MTEDEFQDVCRYPTYGRDRSMLAILTACTDAAESPHAALGVVAEHVTRLCRHFGWRLASLTSDGLPSAELLDAARRLATISLERRDDGRADEIFERLRILWQAARALMQRLHLALGDVLAERANTFRGIGPEEALWEPPPVRPPGPTEPFAVRYVADGASHRLSIDGAVVALDGNQVDFESEQVAISAFEINARDFDARGFRAEPECSAGFPGVLDPVAYGDRWINRLWLKGDRIVAAYISESDPVSHSDSLVPDVKLATEGIGSFSPTAPLPYGIFGIHSLRRLFSHPAAGEVSLHLYLADIFINPVVDWLAASPWADRLAKLELSVPIHDQWGGIRAQARPVGALFPSLRELKATYRSWPMWSAAAFPVLQRLELTEMDAARRWQPTLPTLAEDLVRLTPLLDVFLASAFKTPRDVEP